MALSLTDPNVKKAIRALENEKEIKPIQKALILMTADGKKPATWQQIVSEKWFEGDEPIQITAARWHRLKHIFDGLGLVYVIRTRLDDTSFVQPKDGTHQWIELADIFLSSDMAHANKLAKAVSLNDHGQIGTLLGFPPSAVEAFVSKKTLPIDKRPLFTENVDRNAMSFLNHMVSKDNWEEEISYLPAFSKRVKELSDKIYRGCLK